MEGSAEDRPTVEPVELMTMATPEGWKYMVEPERRRSMVEPEEPLTMAKPGIWKPEAEVPGEVETKAELEELR